jgi:hypothetical protein
VKNYSGGKSGRKDFELMIGGKKGCIFSARGIAKNVRERSSEEKRTKRVNRKNKMPIIFIKGSCVETSVVEPEPEPEP